MEIKLANGQIVVPSMEQIIKIERVLFPKEPTLNVKDELRRIFDVVEAYIGEPLATKRRFHTLVYGRQLYCYVAKQMTTASLNEIAELIGGIDHTSVIHSIQKFKNLHHTELVVQRDLIKVLNNLELSLTDLPIRREKKVPIVKIIIPAVPPKPKEKFIRPKAEYTNTTPYGIAKTINN
jgi:hypothetical protein